MPVSARYTPIAPGDTDEILSFDFAPILASGEIVLSGTLTIDTNTTPPATSTALTVNSVSVSASGTALVASVTAAGGGAGDQLLTFTAATTLRSGLSRSAQIFVGATS